MIQIRNSAHKKITSNISAGEAYIKNCPPLVATKEAGPHYFFEILSPKNAIFRAKKAFFPLKTLPD